MGFSVFYWVFYLVLQACQWVSMERALGALDVLDDFLRWCPRDTMRPMPRQRRRAYANELLHYANAVLRYANEAHGRGTRTSLQSFVWRPTHKAPAFFNPHTHTHTLTHPFILSIWCVCVCVCVMNNAAPS